MKTIRQALIDEISYPLSEGLIDNKIIYRGLDAEANFDSEVAHSAEYNGAVADCLYALVEAPNFSEADVSFSMSDKALILKRANALYKSIGEDVNNIDEPMVYIGG